MTDRFVVSGQPGPQRLDRMLRARYPQSGRQAIQQLINGRKVQVNGRTVWLASWNVTNGDAITVLEPPELLPSQPDTFDPAWLIADEGDLIAVNKPSGLLSEPARASDRASLLELAVAEFGPLTLFHRLDRDTSGVMLLTRAGAINTLLARAFQERLIRKEYRAVVAAPNQLDASGVIDARLDTDPHRKDRMILVHRGGQRAITQYAVLASAPDRQWVQLVPGTGRQHQLRVHLAHLHAPILGDRLYGSVESAPRLMLHAYAIELPATLFGATRRYIATCPPGFVPPSSDAARKENGA